MVRDEPARAIFLGVACSYFLAAITTSFANFLAGSDRHHYIVALNFVVFTNTDHTVSQFFVGWLLFCHTTNNNA